MRWPWFLVENSFEIKADTCPVGCSPADSCFPRQRFIMEPIFNSPTSRMPAQAWHQLATALDTQKNVAKNLETWVDNGGTLDWLNPFSKESSDSNIANQQASFARSVLTDLWLFALTDHPTEHHYSDRDG